VEASLRGRLRLFAAQPGLAGADNGLGAGGDLELGIKMLETWLRAVLGLRCSLRAISGLVSWRAMRSRISRSRSVSCEKASLDAGRELAKYCIRRLAMAGPKIASPLTTARVERRISALREPLSR
jgi:hypothetical protein